MTSGANDRTRSPAFLNVLASAYALNALGRIGDIAWLLLLFSILPMSQVAIFATASAAAAFFAMAVDAGLNQVLLREFSAGRLQLREGARIALRVRLGLIAVAMVAGLLWTQSMSTGADLRASIVAACAVQILVLIETFCQQWLKANDRQTTANALSALDPFLKVAAAALLLGASSATAADFFVLQIVYHVGLAAISLFVCWRSMPARRTDFSSTSVSLIGASVVFAAIGAVTVIQNRLDWLLIARFADAVAIANYSLVNRCYEVLMMLIGTGALTLLPRLCVSASAPSEGAHARILFRLILSFGVLATGVATLVLPFVVAIVWGAKYADSGLLFAMLMPIASLSTLIQLLYYQAVSRGAERQLLIITAISTCVQAAINVIAVPRWGGLGAVAGMLGLAVSNLMFFVVRRRSLAVSVPLLRPITYVAGMAIMYLAVACGIRNLAVAFPLIVVVWLCASGAWLFSRSDRAQLLDWMRSILTVRRTAAQRV